MQADPFMLKTDPIDACSSLREEVEALKGEAVPEKDGVSGSLQTFYSRASELFRYYDSHPEADEAEADSDPLLDLEPKVSFSGQEVHGRYVDIAQLLDLYNRVPAAPALTGARLAASLATFDKSIAEVLGEPRLDDASYRAFVRATALYLFSYFSRTHPLTPCEEMLREPFEAFQAELLSADEEGAELDLDTVSCAQELEAIGLDALKRELMKRGLKCG
jgi:hypothetical protein